MKTFWKVAAIGTLAVLGFSARSAEAQVSVGIATPGFALGVGSGAGYVGGYGYPGVVAPPIYGPPIYAPRPLLIPPPVYARPYYGGYGYGYGHPYGHPYHGGPRGGYPGRHYR